MKHPQVEGETTLRGKKLMPGTDAVDYPLNLTLNYKKLRNKKSDRQNKTKKPT